MRHLRHLRQGFVMRLLLPCLSSAAVADERRHRHERHLGSQSPLARHADFLTVPASFQGPAGQGDNSATTAR